jgi:hypothetical protein
MKTGLGIGTHRATVTVEAESEILDSPAQIPVTLQVVEQVHETHLPLVLRGR